MHDAMNSKIAGHLKSLQTLNKNMESILRMYTEKVYFSAHLFVYISQTLQNWLCQNVLCI